MDIPPVKLSNTWRPELLRPCVARFQRIFKEPSVVSRDVYRMFYGAEDGRSTERVISLLAVVGTMENCFFCPGKRSAVQRFSHIQHLMDIASLLGISSDENN